MRNQLLTLIFILSNLTVWSQTCEENFVSYNFRLEICNNSNWNISPDYRERMIKINSDTVSSTMQINILNKEMSSKELFYYSLSKDLKIDTSSILKLEPLEVGTVAGYFGVVKLNTRENPVRSNLLIITFNFEGMRYLLKSTCSSGLLLKREVLLKKIASEITLINREVPLTGTEIEALIKFETKLFHSLKKSDSTELKRLIVSQEKFLSEVNNSIRDELFLKRMTLLAENNWDQWMDSEKIEDNLKGIISSGSEYNIDWNEIEMVEFKYYPTYDMMGLKTVHASLKFKHENTLYFFELKSLILTEKAWYIMELDNENVIVFNN